jgi:NADPH-dependent glutamate synthase beta chain and related oxidoreductases
LIIFGDKKINEAKIIKMQLGSPDESGRKKPEPIEGSEENHKVDLIIEALGFEPENLPSLFNQKDLELTKWGTVKINYQSMMTNIEGVFAAGDIVRGASLVVWGIKDGRDVAKKIEDFLVNKEKNTDKSKYQKKDLAYA